jgi:hypothetical protein
MKLARRFNANGIKLAVGPGFHRLLRIALRSDDFSRHVTTLVVTT